MNNTEIEDLMKIGTNAPPQLQRDAQKIFPKFFGETGVIVATGPSLTREQLDIIDAARAMREKGVRVFTINNSFEKVVRTDVHLSCDGPWWRYYWPRWKELRELEARKFTWYPEISDAFGIEYIKGIVKHGLSTDPSVVHINHGSGPMMINLAYHFGVTKLVLIGHDMKFAPDYNPQKQDPGSIPRHYFGEYPKVLQHWPSVKVKQGVLDGLIESYDGIQQDILDKRLSLEIVNCTPGSALTSFRRSTLEEEL